MQQQCERQRFIKHIHIYIQVPYCTIPPNSSEVESQSHDIELEDLHNTASGQMAKNKMWSGKYDTLPVYFINPEVLNQVGLNSQNIIDWAKMWEHHNYQNIPKFSETNEETGAVIRVRFG